MNTRTRFAPSPTGYLHVGGIRTALFAYLVARSGGGKFVLRLEDTDKNREVAGSAEHLISSLTSLGLNYDEGPNIGGPYAPYRQSDRLDIYKKWAQKLIDAGRAYADPYTAQEVQTFREQAQKEKRAFLYRHHRPENPPAWDGTTPLRFRSEPKNYTWDDAVMGVLKTGPEVIDDFILIKSDGYPTYNFCHIVDDAEMQITHIIRGQEFLSSTPNYLNLYEALNKINREAFYYLNEGHPGERKNDSSILLRPEFATMPHIMNEQGNKKLGKRDGAKDVLDYLRDGYLPEALVSFISTMGWNDGTTQEVFTHQELIEKFSLSRVQRSGARFDEKRLLWVNGHFIRELSVDELYVGAEKFWPEAARDAVEDYKKQVLELAQDRLKTLADLQGFDYFFAEPTPNPELISENKQLKKLEQSYVNELISKAKEALSDIDDWTAENIQNTLNTLLETTGEKPGILFSLVRIHTTWAPFSPELAPTLALIGKQKTLARLAVS